MAYALQAKATQLLLGMAHKITHIHPTHLIGVKGWTKSQVLWCNAHNMRVGDEMAKLVVLQLVQPGAKFATRGPTNERLRGGGGARRAGAPPPPGFLHTMLSVKRVKNNMQQAFIEKLFTNCEIETSMTRYLCFKSMSYKSESYLCDITYVQLRKAPAQFQCDSTQLEVMLGVWKGVPYVKRLC
jgi:hypothetical protein